MISNRLAFAALAIACLGAAAGGGYLASRQNTVPAVAEAESSTAPVAASTPAPVQETEAIVGEPSEGPAARPAARPAASSEAPVVAAPAASVPAPTPKRPVMAERPLAQPQAPARPSRPSGTNAKAAEPLPTLERTWPSGAAVNTPPAQSGPAPSAASPSIAATTPSLRTEERAAQETPRAPEPPQKTYEELVVASDSVIGLQAETSVTSERARVEDRVEARVTRDVRVRDMVAIPEGARVLGSVVSVDRGGKFKERARLGIRFNTLVLADGTRLPISTQTFYRDGDAPGKESAAKMTGAAVGGAILGAILGGGKGAAIGATAGAGAGAAAVMAAERNAATLSAGQQFTVRILSPVSVTLEQK